MKIAATALGALLLSAGASATPLVAGDDGVAPITAFADTLDVLLADGTQTVNTGLWVGTYRYGVYRDTDTGYLDFVYQFSNLDNGRIDEHFIKRLTFFDFGGWTVDMFQTAADVDGAGLTFTDGDVGIASGSRTVDPVVGAALSGAGLGEGDDSYTVILRTNAEYYTVGTFTAQNGAAQFVLAYSPTLRPDDQVPAPAALGLLGLGLLGFAGMRRR